MEFGGMRALSWGRCFRGAHQEGCIKNQEDLKSIPGREILRVTLNAMRRTSKNFAATCPPGMKELSAVWEMGFFESVQDIVGYMDLCFIKADDEELYRDIFLCNGTGAICHLGPIYGGI